MSKESSEAYYNVDSSTEEIFMDVFNKKSFPVNIKIQFVGNSKQKQLIKVSKLCIILTIFLFIYTRVAGPITFY